LLLSYQQCHNTVIVIIYTLCCDASAVCVKIFKYPLDKSARMWYSIDTTVKHLITEEALDEDTPDLGRPEGREKRIR